MWSAFLDPVRMWSLHIHVCVCQPSVKTSFPFYVTPGSVLNFNVRFKLVWARNKTTSSLHLKRSFSGRDTVGGRTRSPRSWAGLHISVDVCHRSCRARAASIRSLIRHACNSERTLVSHVVSWGAEGARLWMLNQTERFSSAVIFQSLAVTFQPFNILLFVYFGFVYILHVLSAFACLQ